MKIQELLSKFSSSDFMIPENPDLETDIDALQYFTPGMTKLNPHILYFLSGEPEPPLPPVPEACFLCPAFSAFYCRSIGKLLYSVLYTVSSPFPIFYAQNFQTGLIQSQFS